MKPVLRHSALALALAFFSASARAQEQTTIGPWPERPFSVLLKRDPGATCTLRPEEVLDRVMGYALECTPFDKTALGWSSGDRRAVWFIASHAGDACWNNTPSGSWIILDDATGREMGRGLYPCPERPKRPEGPPTYVVKVDPGVGCRMLPDEVAEKFSWQGIVSMRCTTMNRLVEMSGPEGLDQRVVWLVDQRGEWSIIEDASGMVTAYGGSGGARRPVPVPPWPPEP